MGPNVWTSAYKYRKDIDYYKIRPNLNSITSSWLGKDFTKKKLNKPKFVTQDLIKNIKV